MEEPPESNNRVLLVSGQSQAEISLTGAEIRCWRIDGIDLLWTPDPKYWGRVAPVLFPIVGWPNNGAILAEGRRRAIGVHGFAKTCQFEVLETSEGSVLLELRPTEQTLDLYPFQFRLRVRYMLTASTMGAAFEVLNLGNDAMPYAVGVHPGFRWPLPGNYCGPHELRFEADESREVPVVTSSGYISNRELRSIPLEGRTLRLDPSLFENDVLCFLNAKSKRVVFSNGEVSLTISTEHFPHWGIWSKPGAKFLSIQTWTSFGDAPDFKGSIYEKPSMILLGPGKTMRHTVEWAFRRQS